MNDRDLHFARHYFDHEIRFGVVDGNVDLRARKSELIAFDSHASRKDFREFKKFRAGQFKLALSWFSEGARLRELGSDGHLQCLPTRERECLQWTASGLNSSQISERLGISDATVNEHIQSAMKRLGASTRIQASARAALWGLAPL